MKNISYWLDTVHGKEHPSFSGDKKCDIAVIGAGFTGITAALLLSKTGAQVTVIEADRVGKGTSGHATVKVTLQHSLKLNSLGEKKAEAYYKANKAGFDRIAEFIKEYNIDCDFESRPAYVYTRDDEDIPQIEKEERMYETLGIAGGVTEDTGLPFKVKRSIVMDNQAQFHPVKYIYALADEFVKSGGSIYENTKAVGFERDGECRVRTENGILRAKSVIFATNYPLVEFPGLFFLKLHQERSYALCTKAGDFYVPGMYINVKEPVNSIRMHKLNGEDRLILAGYGHRTGKDSDDITGYDRLRDALKTDFKDACQTPDYEWSAEDSQTLDGIPYVGAIYDKQPNVYVASGYEKWGVTNSAAAALMLSDEIAGTNYIDCEYREKFDPLRFTPGASAKNFFIHAGNVAMGFTSDNALIFSGKYDDLERGEGAVLRVDGKAQAIYRDPSGEIHAYSVHCPHLGCTLEYNKADNSFDCPCHGSRFTMYGDILNGPAKEPLKRLETEEEKE